jgi:hypothetical protein
VPDVELLKWLNSVGTVGLALMVWGLMTRRLITRGEFDSAEARAAKWEARFDKAAEYGHRAVQAGQTLIEKQSS